MKQPNGMDIMETLIRLLAEQEHLIITYTLVDRFGNIRKRSTKDSPTTPPNQL